MKRKTSRSSSSTRFTRGERVTKKQRSTSKKHDEGMYGSQRKSGEENPVA
jgi:hypothetical protein